MRILQVLLNGGLLRPHKSSFPGTESCRTTLNENHCLPDVLTERRSCSTSQTLEQTRSAGPSLPERSIYPGQVGYLHVRQGIRTTKKWSRQMSKICNQDRASGPAGLPVPGTRNFVAAITLIDGRPAMGFFGRLSYDFRTQAQRLIPEACSAIVHSLLLHVSPHLCMLSDGQVFCVPCA